MSRAESESFQIVSWNMLAHVYLTRNLSKDNPDIADFATIPPEIESWEFRKALFVDRFSKWDADMYLFQECERAKFMDEFGEFFHDRGYGIIMQERKKSGKSGHHVCVSTVYRLSKFEHLGSDPRSRALVSAFQLVAEPKKTIFVVNVHLEAKSTNELKRLSQLASVFQSLGKLHRKVSANAASERAQDRDGLEQKSDDSAQESTLSFPSRVIIGGDFNADPDGKVFKLMKHGKLCCEDDQVEKDIETPIKFLVAQDASEKKNDCMSPAPS
eukprot:TRINITY_DN8714_c0_g1_i1.p1 TRINITY_DN8714_c0_g1~~TRINITY_DN8714_c0_g1_i1.p1  ORF type:complete len:271 (+),score=45.89 TRINITY_DN8714_c0_g1_i1:39-851(+)